MKLKLGICADLHTEFIHDAPKRMEIFLNRCQSEKVDACIQLGDFCPPGPIKAGDKEKILQMTKRFPHPFYHIIGNHDTDSNSKENVLSFLGQERSYFSVDLGGVHLIMLDACFYREKGIYRSYDNCNYRRIAPGSLIPILPPDELEWLKNDLASAAFPSVLFSHQSLVESRSGIRNAPELREILKSAPAGVLAAVCGHEHVDRLNRRDGIYYYCLNSMSYYWAGERFRHSTYGEAVEKDSPMLQVVFPYRDPLFAIMEISDRAIGIQGTSSSIVGLTPAKICFSKPGLVDAITPTVTDRFLRLKQRHG